MKGGFVMITDYQVQCCNNSCHTNSYRCSECPYSEIKIGSDGEQGMFCTEYPEKE